jgi:hypothetical protein
MVVVRTQDHSLIAQDWIVPWQDTYDIASDQRTSLGVSGGGSIAANGERLEPSAGGWLKAYL